MLLQTFPGSELVHLLQGMPWVDRVFTVDEVNGAQVTRKLYRIASELPHDKWQVQLVSVKEEPYIVELPVNEATLKRIGTHDGTFHCDEALACFPLKQLPEYARGRARHQVCIRGSVRFSSDGDHSRGTPPILQCNVLFITTSTKCQQLVPPHKLFQTLFVRSACWGFVQSNKLATRNKKLLIMTMTCVG